MVMSSCFVCANSPPPTVLGCGLVGMHTHATHTTTPPPKKKKKKKQNTHTHTPNHGKHTRREVVGTRLWYRKLRERSLNESSWRH